MLLWVLPLTIDKLSSILQLAKTCYNMYMSTPTKMAGENYNFHRNVSPESSTCLSVLQIIGRPILWFRPVYCCLKYVQELTWNVGEQGMNVGTSWSIMRPETVESFMYLWRKTGDQKYRDWGWDIFQAFETQSRTPTGYVGLRDVRSSWHLIELSLLRHLGFFILCLQCSVLWL